MQGNNPKKGQGVKLHSQCGMLNSASLRAATVCARASASHCQGVRSPKSCSKGNRGGLGCSMQRSGCFSGDGSAIQLPIRTM